MQSNKIVDAMHVKTYFILLTSIGIAACSGNETSTEVEPTESTENNTSPAASGSASGMAARAWVFDVDAYAKIFEMESGKPIDAALMDEMTSMLSSTYLNLNDDGTWDMQEVSGMYGGKGTWSLSEDGTKLALNQENTENSRVYNVAVLTPSTLLINHEATKDGQTSKARFIFKPK